MSQYDPHTATSHWQVHACGLAAVIALSAVAYLFGFAPMLEGRHQAAAARRDLDDRRQKATQLVSQRRSLAAELDDLGHKQADSPLRLEPQTQINRRLAGLTDLAAAAGLDLRGIQPGKPAPGPKAGGVTIGVVPIDLTGTGSFRACAAFLHNVRQSFPDSGVSDFQLSSTPADPPAPAAFHFTILWYTSDPAPR